MLQLVRILVVEVESLLFQVLGEEFKSLLDSSITSSVLRFTEQIFANETAEEITGLNHLSFFQVINYIAEDDETYSYNIQLTNKLPLIHAPKLKSTH